MRQKQLQAGEWSKIAAPTLEDFAALAERAFAKLPSQFRAMCRNVAFLIEDFPDAELLQSLGLRSEYDLLGVYEGAGEAVASSGDPLASVNRVVLFRRPLLDYWAEHEETLGDLIAHVLIHEIGHHFGLSDEDMAAIEAAAG